MIVAGQKYRWHVPEHDAQHATALAARFNVSVPVVQTLLSRGYDSPERIEKFLFSSQERDVAHPSLLKDASKAVERIIAALDAGEKILICGDYDVDGITSSALMLMCLLPLGAQINFFLPNRARDGYGLSPKTIERAAHNNYRVIITVDNGITAFEPARLAKQYGIDLIVTDHHKPHSELPDAFAVIDPHQDTCEYPFKSFAGVGVSFKIMALLYEKLGKPLPDSVYELLLLGTVADVVPLVDENRFWVRYGLNHVKKYESTALKVLKQNARFSKPTLSSTDIGFFLTPQINALGRLDDPREGVTFLLSHEVPEVERIGTVLARLNEARKSVERGILAQIEEELKGYDFSKERIIIASNTKWPAGVIGLAASRLVSSYHRPAFLFHITADGIAKGSCRSITAFNVFNALGKVKDLLLTFGGHAAAAGLSLPLDKLPEFKARMHEIIMHELDEEDFQPTLHLDAQLSLRETSTRLMHDLSFLEPFGCENAVPLFYIKNVSFVGDVQLLKEAHVKCTIFHDGIIKPVIFFNRPELIQKIQENRERYCSVAVHVMENHWNGTVKIEYQGIDIAFHE